MKPVSPFLELENAPRVDLSIDGEVISAPLGANLAASLLAAGVNTFRASPVSGAPRGPFCMMGACFECSVEIDGVTRQACMIEVAEGLEITRPRRDEALT